MTNKTGLSDTITFTWGTSGTKAITVTAINARGKVTGTHTVTILATAVVSPVMQVVPSRASVSVGEPVTAAVTISNVTNMYSFTFTLVYSSSLVTVQHIIEGDFPGSTGRDFTYTHSVNNNAGRVTFIATSTGDEPGPSGAGDLAYVRLRARAPGTASLCLENVGLKDAQNIR